MEALICAQRRQIENTELDGLSLQRSLVSRFSAAQLVGFFLQRLLVVSHLQKSALAEAKGDHKIQKHP